MSTRLRWTTTVVSVALGMIVLAGTAQAASVSSLRSRLRSVDSNRARLEQTLRELKSDQAAAYRKLNAAKSDLAAARRRRDQAKARLAEVRKVLRNIKAEQERTRNELEKHRKEMSARVVAMWRAGEPSYFEVVIEATSFDDFANRSDIVRSISAQDEEMLDGLAELRDQLESQRATLEAKEREAAALRTKIASETALVERRTREARALAVGVDRDRAKVEREYAEELAARRDIEAMIKAAQRGDSGPRYSGTSDGRFMRPVNGRLSSAFGYRIHPILHTRRFHNGIDLAAPSGTSIKAAGAGRVIVVGWKHAYGKTVVIDHGSGWSTMYGHCSSYSVSRNQIVSKGQTIARVGSTGWSTGPHLHWTIYRNGKAVNPLNHS